MIKAKLDNPHNGRSYLLLGLDNENLKRLKENQPIGFEVDSIPGYEGPPHTIIIMWGESYAKIQDQMAGITPTPIGLQFSPPPPKSD